MENINECLKNYKKSKDKKWFEKIYEQVMPNIYRFYYLKTFNKELSEDLTSEVFIRIYLNLSKANLNERSFMVWIYKIASNLLIDYYRKNKNTPASEVLDEDSIKVFDREIFLKNSSLLRKELGFENTKVVKALSKLTKLQQDVILLKFVEDLDYKTIGLIFGKKQGTVRGIMFRALGRLKNEIEGSGE